MKYVSETLGASDPGAPTIKVDPSLRPGAKVLEQSAHRGMRSRLWKYVYVDGVETEKEILHTDTYMAYKAIYSVGPELPAVAPVLPPDQPAAPAETQPAVPSGPASDGPASEIAPPTALAPVPEAPAAPAAPEAPAAPADPAPVPGGAEAGA